MKQRSRTYYLKKSAGITSLIGLFIFLISPMALFDEAYSSVITDRKGQMLGAQIASDGQWRFPLMQDIPKEFADALICFEDKRFKTHIGIDIRAFARATRQNLKARRIVSGGSTITMQVIRLSRKDKPRTFKEKAIEAILALKLDLRCSKSEILALYAAHAPFGGNVIGLETASWRYFGKSPDLLSIGEGAMLAVLPNAPSLIHPGKNRALLLAKRNRLLARMLDQEIIDQTAYDLALMESLPAAPIALARNAPHLLERMKSIYGEGKRYDSSLDLDIQQHANFVATNHYQFIKQSDIHNLGILIMDNSTAEVLAYVGNSPGMGEEYAVDMVQARRSSGSVLKPLLYAHMLEDGIILPQMLMKDIPAYINGFSPRNYNRQFLGAVPADEALSRSLNVPSVLALQRYGIDPFLNRLRSHGISTLGEGAEHYGLSLILGGGEVSLWELCGVYSSMARILNRFNDEQSKYLHADIKMPSLVLSEVKLADSYRPNLLSAGAISQTFDAMKKVKRPNGEGGWEQYSSSREIAWKTGTSFGHKDAWAIGVTGKYTIGVWVGNSDGEGKHGLVGVKKAAPILFDILNGLPDDHSFAEAVDDLYPNPICQKSGHLAGSYCDDVDTVYILKQGQKTKICPYHQQIHINQAGLQAHSECSSIFDLAQKNVFVLAPEVAQYYRKNHPEYEPLPPFDVACSTKNGHQVQPMNFIYPGPKHRIFLPIDLDGKQESVVFKVSHQHPGSLIYWHLDAQYLGYTEDLHNMRIAATPGMHKVTLVDQWGNTIHREFEIVGQHLEHFSSAGG